MAKCATGRRKEGTIMPSGERLSRWDAGPARTAYIVVEEPFSSSTVLAAPTGQWRVGNVLTA